MAKKLSDIKSDKSGNKLDLRSKYQRKRSRKFIKEKNVFYKHENPIHEVSDLKGQKKEQYIYVKGKQFKPPQYLGNLVRIGFAGFLILLIINTINVYFTGKNIEEDISVTAYQGYNYLVDAGKSATKIQFDNALSAFDMALENFNDAEKDLWFINQDKTFYAQEDSVGQAVNALLESGKHFAVAGKYFLEALEEFNKIPVYFVAKNKGGDIDTPSITDALKDGLEKTDLAIGEISEAQLKMVTINEKTLPPEVRSRVTLAKNKIEEVSSTLSATSEHFPALLKLLGDRYPHRYLILFQNNNEIRPTGGFIGSYVIMDVNEGYIEKLETYDVYDIDGSYGGIIEPPDEFKSFTSNWRFRDSNYSPDFSVSAKKARWFLEKEGGPTVDTVIAINQGLLRDLLEITGPIQVGDFGKLDYENYNLLLSYVIEGKVWGEEDPKHILKVFVAEFKKAILKEENISKVSSKLYKAIQQKHIMMYSADEEIEALFNSLSVSGTVHKSASDEDYLSIINISTGGTKSEQFIEENITHKTHIDKYGAVIDKVTLKRTHLWTDAIYIDWKKTLSEYGFSTMPDQLIDILGRGRNRVSIRIYVPDGSILLDKSRDDIEVKYDKDLKKAYFFTTMEIKAGESEEITIEYQLPYALDLKPAASYKLFVDKQPGSRGSIFTKELSTDPEIETLAIFPDGSKVSKNSITYATNLVYDRYFSGVFTAE